MATTFPTDTYPLLQDAGNAEHKSRVQRDIMDDGSPRLRFTNVEFLGGWAEIPLAFVPLALAEAQTLTDYLFSNAGTEFDIPYLGGTWTGHLWSEPSSLLKDNQWWVEVKFYGRKTA